MGYFDRIAEAAFKEGENGEIIYFPNGLLGKGRLVKDSERRIQLFNFNKRLNKYLMPSMLLYGILIGLGEGVSLSNILPILTICIIVFIRQRFLIRGLPIYNKKLTLEEAATSASKAFKPSLLIFMMVISLMLILMSITMPFILDESIKEMLFLVLVPLFVGLVSLAISLYLYKMKKI